MIWFKVSHEVLQVEEYEMIKVTKNQIAYKVKGGADRREAREGSGRYPFPVYKWFEKHNDAVEYLRDLLGRKILRLQEDVLTYVSKVNLLEAIIQENHEEQ